MAALNLFDSHCHLEDPQYGIEVPTILRRAREAGVAGMVCIGTDLETSRKSAWLASRHPFIWASAGIHPHYADRPLPDADWEKLRQLASGERVVAIGETGLDYYKKFSRPDSQKALLRRHVELAQSLGKALVFHCRDAYEDLHLVLTEFGGPIRGVVHSFSGTIEQARRFLDLGLSISLSGNITYPDTDGVDEMIRSIPADRLLIETDSPYLSPQPMRGKRNEPSFLVYTAQKIAQVLNEPAESLADRTHQNARAVYGI